MTIYEVARILAWISVSIALPLWLYCGYRLTKGDLK